jgi:hypothetical protein
VRRARIVSAASGAASITATPAPLGLVAVEHLEELLLLHGIASNGASS